MTVDRRPDQVQISLVVEKAEIAGAEPSRRVNALCPSVPADCG